MKRYRIEKKEDDYIIIDNFKRYACIRDIRYTTELFDSKESALGYLFGKGRI
jgi:hypothetical protein